MRERFLEPLRHIPAVDVVVSIRTESANGPLVARDFYNSWLSFWPSGSGSFILYTEEYPIYPRLAECLNREPCSLRVLNRWWNFSQYLHRGFSVRKPGATRETADWQAAQMQLYKFDSDRVASSPIIAFTDDDSCMLDHILPSEIVRFRATRCSRIHVQSVPPYEPLRRVRVLQVTSEGKLVAKGRWEGPGHQLSAELTRYARERNQSTQSLGIVSSVADFMHEFPVYVWREMLADFRAHVIRHVLPHARSLDLPTFWSAIRKLLTDVAPRLDGGRHCDLLPEKPRTRLSSQRLRCTLPSRTALCEVRCRVPNGVHESAQLCVALAKVARSVRVAARRPPRARRARRLRSHTQ